MTEDPYRADRPIGDVGDLLEESADFYMVHDLEGKILSANPALAGFLGYGSPAELVGSSLADLLVPEVRHMMAAQLAALATSGRSRGLMRVQTKGGEERIVEYHNTVHARAAQAGAGHPAGHPNAVPAQPVVRAIARDVTAARRQERILRALYGISQAAFTAPSLDELFPAIHQTIGRLMPARNFFVALHEVARDRLNYPYFTDEHGPGRPPHAPGRGLTAYVLRGGEVLLATPERQAELVASGEVELPARPPQSWLGVPLRIHGRTLGVLAVQSYTSAVAYSEDDKQVLSFVSAHIAAAIERLRARQDLRDSEERLRLAVESAGLTIWDWDLAANRIAPHDSGPQPTQRPGLTRTFEEALNLVVPEDRDSVRLAIANAIAARGDFRLELRIVAPDGSIRWTESLGRVHCDAAGVPVRIVGTVQDISARHAIQEELQHRLRFEQLVAELSSQFIRLSGRGVDDGIENALARIGGFIGADRSYVFLFGADGEHIDNTHEWCAPGIAPRREQLQHIVVRHQLPWFAQRIALDGVCNVPRVDELPVEAAADRAHFESKGSRSLVVLPMVAHGFPLGFVGFDAVRSERTWSPESLALLRFASEFLVNALERRRMERQLQHDALHDGLTGLPNRTALLDRIGQAWARGFRRDALDFALLYVDLDHFESVIDGLGHLAGDKLLTAVVSRLERVLEPGDTLAALGSDEFALLLESVGGATEAQRRAAQVRAELLAPLTLDGGEIFLTASIGIVLSSSAYQNPEQFLRDAQTAVHRAKVRGRSHHEIFDQAMHDEAHAQLELERDLRAAPERGELRLDYQPIVAVRSGEIFGFEALVRWEHPRRGSLLPGIFVPLAEAAGLIHTLGHWVLGEACSQLRRWQEQTGAQLTMSVNLSPSQLMHPLLDATIAAVLAQSNVGPGTLCLELTENSLLDGGASAVLAQLKSRGVAIHLDDFGTGYSSLSYLNRLPIDVLKIDRSFIGNLDAAESLRIIRAIVALAHDLDVGVIVEGVETERQLNYVRRLGIDRAQGRLLGVPMDAAAAGQLLSARGAARGD